MPATPRHLERPRFVVTRSRARSGYSTENWTGYVTCTISHLPFLIHDRDTKFSGPFDEVFRSHGATVILPPIGAPNANAVAERWIGTVRAECLDWTLVLGRRHLDRVLRTYVTHYNAERPHRTLALATPERETMGPTPILPREVRRRDLLGGLIHEYQAAAA